MENERVLYQGRPSQVVNYNTFSICAMIFFVALLGPSIWDKFFAVSYAEHEDMYMLASKALFFIPIIWAFIAWVKIYCHKYTITTERLREESGVLSKTTDELELFRVKDIKYTEPFSLRVFGCGNIIMDTSDRSTPIVVLYALKNAKPVIEILRTNVQRMRTLKGVREID